MTRQPNQTDSVTGLVDLPIRRPWLVIALFALITLAAVPGLLRLELRTDGHALVPADDPAVVFDAEVRERFHLRDPLVVLIESSHPDGVLNPRTLRSVQEISGILARLPGVDPEDVISLATERRHRVYPGTLNFRPFLDPVPDTPELLKLLDDDLRIAKILDGTLISTDRKAVTVLVGVPPLDPAHPYDRVDLYRRVADAVRPFANDTDRIDVVGAPAAESLLGTHILDDLRLLLPLSLAVIGFVVRLGTRRMAGVAIAGLKIVACLVWTFGLMGWVGSPVYLTTAVLPVILVTVGLASEIHILWHYQRDLARALESGGSSADALAETFGELRRPVFFSAATTAFGFFSFLVSPLAPVRAFGLFAGLGVLFCMLASLSLVPALLRLLPASRLTSPRQGSRGSGGVLRRLAAPFLSRPVWTLAALLGATVVLGLGATRLFIQDSWVDGFSPDSSFRQATDRVNGRLFGTHILLAHLRFDLPKDRVPETFDRQGPLLDPALLREIGRFEAEIRSQPGVGGVLGPYSYLTAVHALWMGGVESARVIPDTPERVGQLIEKFDQGRGVRRRQEVIADDLRSTVVTIFLKDANFRDTDRLMRTVRASSERLLGARGGHVDFAGDVAVSQAMIPAIVKTQVSSVLGSLLGCLAALLLLHRSLKLGLVAVLPTALSTLWIFGLMGWLGIPLGVATSMFCAITIGIGDDYAIHFVDRYRAALAAGGSSPVLQAIEEAGPAIVYDTLAIALGFGLLGVSLVPANARLGILVSLTLVAGCLLTLIGLGALLQAGVGSRLAINSATSRKRDGSVTEISTY